LPQGVNVLQRFLSARRVVVILITVGIVLALGIGLWPVNVNVFGDASYSCGSGLIHSAHDWNQDSQALRFERSGTDTATGLPSTACPNKVDSRRDLALLVVAFSLVFALIAQILLEWPQAQARSYRAMLRPIGIAKIRATARRPRSGESSIQ
jgi:hypothetical protein